MIINPKNRAEARQNAIEVIATASACKRVETSIIESKAAVSLAWSAIAETFPHEDIVVAEDPDENPWDEMRRNVKARASLTVPESQETVTVTVTPNGDAGTVTVSTALYDVLKAIAVGVVSDTPNGRIVATAEDIKSARGYGLEAAYFSRSESWVISHRP